MPVFLSPSKRVNKLSTLGNELTEAFNVFSTNELFFGAG